MLAQLSDQVRGLLVVRDSRGQALVEAALTLLLLCVFIFAIFEGGRLIQVQQTLTDAAREGARRSVAPLTQTLPGDLPSVGDVQAVVQSYLGAASVRGANIAVDQAFSDGTRTYTVVTVTYPYRVMTLSMFGMLNMTLTGTARMRNETSAQ